jgi:hypothetical protein
MNKISVLIAIKTLILINKLYSIERFFEITN